MRVRVVLGMMMLVASNAQGAKDAAVPLAPSGKWIVDYGENSCGIWRKFNAGPSGDVSFGVEPLTLAQTAVLTFVVPGGSKNSAKAARIVLAPSGQSLTISGDKHGVLPEGGSAARLGIKRNDLPALFAASSLTVDFGDSVSITLTSGQDASKALQACETDLMTKWKVDPAEVAAAARATEISNLQEIFRSEDYPKNSTKDPVPGSSLTIVKVGTNGRVAVCRTIASGGNADLDNAICSSLTRRATYKPAIDREGKAVAGWWSRKVTWPRPQ
jgi:hypothetical protein